MSYAGPFPYVVKQGGTGDATLTSNCVLLGNGTSPISSFAPATNGQLIIGNTGNPPSLAVPTNGSNINWTTGAGSLQADLSNGTNGQVLLGGGTNAVWANITAGANITLTTGVNTLTIAANSSASTINYTAVSSSPYVVSASDDYLGVNSSGGAITINLPNAPTTGRVFVIKDTTGSSGTHTITITTVGGVVTLDGATSQLIDINYQSLAVIFNGTSYEIY